jgi:Ca2+-transporting ATPase
MAIRSSHRSIFRLGFFSNRSMVIALAITVLLQLTIIYTPFFNEVFKIQPLTFTELMITIAVSSIVFWVVELEKIFKRRKLKLQQVNT